MTDLRGLRSRALVILSRRIALLLALAGGAAVGKGWAQSAEPALHQLSARFEGSEVRVTANLVNGFTPEILERLGSGEKVVFVFHIELRRIQDGWVDRTLERRHVKHSVRLDLLKGVYHIVRLEGHAKVLLQRETPGEMQSTVARLNRLVTVSRDLLRPGMLCYVRARAESEGARPAFPLNYLLWFLPQGMQTKWKLTPAFAYQGE